MKKLGVGATALVGLVLASTLAGCSAGATQAEACAAAGEAADSLTKAFDMAGDAKTGADAEVYLTPILEAADGVRAIEGPAEFIALRDAIADATVAFAEKGVEVAHGRADYGTEMAELSVALGDMEGYCPGL